MCGTRNPASAPSKRAPSKRAATVSAASKRAATVRMTQTVQVVPVTADRWPDVRAVFGTRGDPARCWCQWFFTGARVERGAVAAANEAALRGQIERASTGLLAYVEREPVGWVAIGPRPLFTRLERSPLTRESGPESFTDGSVWSVTCFVVKVGARRRGVATALLHGAVDHARRQGATAVEAYPVDLEQKPSISASSLYHGALSTFLGAGFVETARPFPARPVVRLPLQA